MAINFLCEGRLEAEIKEWMQSRRTMAALHALTLGIGNTHNFLWRAFGLPLNIPGHLSKLQCWQIVATLTERMSKGEIDLDLSLKIDFPNFYELSFEEKDGADRIGNPVFPIGIDAASENVFLSPEEVDITIKKWWQFPQVVAAFRSYCFRPGTVQDFVFTAIGRAPDSIDARVLTKMHQAIGEILLRLENGTLQLD